jgi:ribosomal-protein-serine acetyltransferase
MFRVPIDADLELRLIAEADTDALFQLTDRNRAHLRRWLPWVDGTVTPADTAAFVGHALYQYTANRGFQAGIWYQGRLAGVIGYHPIDWTRRQVEIGYWLGAEFEGRGLMTRACRAMVDYAVYDLGLDRVQIRCAPGNTRSCAIPERLGFERDGVQREAEWLYDHFVDLVVYRMAADDWRRLMPRTEEPSPT